MFNHIGYIQSKYIIIMNVFLVKFIVTKIEVARTSMYITVMIITSIMGWHLTVYLQFLTLYVSKLAMYFYSYMHFI